MASAAVHWGGLCLTSAAALSMSIVACTFRTSQPSCVEYRQGSVLGPILFLQSYHRLSQVPTCPSLPPVSHINLESFLHFVQLDYFSRVIIDWARSPRVHRKSLWQQHIWNVNWSLDHSQKLTIFSVIIHTLSTPKKSSKSDHHIETRITLVTIKHITRSNAQLIWWRSQHKSHPSLTCRFSFSCSSFFFSSFLLSASFIFSWRIRSPCTCHIIQLTTEI